MKVAAPPGKCAECGHNSVRDMHPEDLASQRESEREAAANIDAYFARHIDRFKLLVQTYGDGRAEDELAKLRELFWSASPAGTENVPAAIKRENA